MNERSRNIVVGITALAGLIGFGFLLLLFGYVPAWLEEGYRVSVTLPSASGLSEGSRVRLSGIDIGRIDGVEFQEPVSQGVIAHARIRPDIRIPAGARARVESATLLGGNVVLAFDASKTPPDQLNATLPTDGSAVVAGDQTTMAGQLMAGLEQAMVGPTKQLERMVVSFEKLGDEWTAVGRNINQLTEPRALADVSPDKPGNLATVLARADQRLVEMQQVLDGLNQWVGDQQVRDDFKATVANARNVTEKLSTGADKISDLATKAGESVDTLSKRYVAVADDLAGAIGSMRQAIDQARQGEGTIGKLINDPALYNNLNDAAQRLDASLRDFRLLIDKWKSEGLPLQF